MIALFLAGCSSPPGPANPTPTVVTPPLDVRVSPTLAADEKLVMITSEPVGARVLVNNRLVGRAPLELRVKVTSHGFCADYITVKARFVADGTRRLSRTIESELTPREKAPAGMAFTPEGVQWRLK